MLVHGTQTCLLSSLKRSTGACTSLGSADPEQRCFDHVSDHANAQAGKIGRNLHDPFAHETACAAI